MIVVLTMDYVVMVVEEFWFVRMITVILDRFVVVLQVLCQIQILVCLVLLELVVIVDILVATLS